jgi:hypothetical protein
MQVSKQLPQSVLAALVAVAVAAPVAGAVPIYDGHPPHRATGEAYDVNRETGAYMPAGASGDMHASTVAPAVEKKVVASDLRTEGSKSAFEKQVVASDLRTEGSKSPIESTLVTDELPAGGDLRSEAAKGPGTSTPPVGLPTWPTNPVPIVPPGPEPVQATEPDGGSFDWTLAGLIAAGLAAFAGAALATRQQMRGHTRPAH